MFHTGVLHVALRAICPNRMQNVEFTVQMNQTVCLSQSVFELCQFLNVEVLLYVLMWMLYMWWICIATANRMYKYTVCMYVTS